jgi:NADH oxidase (H2O2-forming)
LTKNNRVIIIGCGAGGGTAAQFARKTDRKAEITIFEKGPYPQYSKCGLPYTISEEIPKIKNLIEFTEEWFQKSKIDLYLNTTVEKIDTKNKKITSKNKEKTIEKNYDSLIIATGAKPFIPPIKNIKENNKLPGGIYTVRTIDDAKKIKSFIEEGDKATIVGAGLIGLEMADCLYKKNMDVTIVEALPNILMNTLDQDMSKLVLEKIPDDVKIFINHIASEIQTKNGDIESVIIKNNDDAETKTVDTDLLIIAAGNKPETKLAEQIGCKIGETGGIKVDNKSQTNIKNIYAVGDCTEYKDFVTNKSILIGLGSIAVRQGIAAGVNSAGEEYILPGGFINTCTSEFFNIEIAAVGPNKKCLSEISTVQGKYKGLSLPEYFPGGKPITMKIYADENKETIIAAQAAGDKAAQRINTVACAVLNKTKLEFFRKLETAYAPPIAPTLDTVTLTADIAAMKLKRKKNKEF